MDLLHGAVLWYVVSCICSSLPEPRDGERWYEAAYNLAQKLGANAPLYQFNIGARKEK